MKSHRRKLYFEIERNLEMRERTQRVFLILALASIFLFMFTACTMNPTLYKDAKGRDVVTLGGSLLTKVKTESASITRPDGTVLTYNRTGKNEVSVPNAVIAGSVAETLSGDWLASDTAATAAEVSKTQINAEKLIKVTDSNNAVKTAEILVPE